MTEVSFTHPLIFSEDPVKTIEDLLEKMDYDRLVIVTEETVFHALSSFFTLIGKQIEPIILPPGEDTKSVASLVELWSAFVREGLSRKSIVISVGGGMISDLAGFAAATYKRGIRTINVPTTLLAAVDASVGGKTGINFEHLKNEVGAFHQPEAVVIAPSLFATLDDRNLLSGYAEMLKHGLISNRSLWRDTLRFDPLDRNYTQWHSILSQTLAVKDFVVAQDPQEKKLRKVLNFGHTGGHAFESLAKEKGRSILHGEAVAAGMVVELYISRVQAGFCREDFLSTIYRIKELYSPILFSCKDYPRLVELMKHDKKSVSGQLFPVLLEAVGSPILDCPISAKLFEEGFDFYRESFGM